MMGFPGGAVVKNPPDNADLRNAVPSLGQEDPLEKEMATLSNILAWRILWTEEPGGLQSMRSHRVGHDWSDLTHTHTHTSMCCLLVSFILSLFLLYTFFSINLMYFVILFYVLYWLITHISFLFNYCSRIYSIPPYKFSKSIQNQYCITSHCIPDNSPISFLTSLLTNFLFLHFTIPTSQM